MMGKQAAPEQLFYDFCLDDHVPADHLLRKIDQFLDFGAIRSRLRNYYSHLGRPSVDPELLLRMLIVGYCFAIRSERRLCEEVHLNLAYRWFCGLGLAGKVPDHSSFSANRNGRFRDSDILRAMFESTVERCLREGLVKGDRFAVDASLIEADANKQRSIPGPEWRAMEIGEDAKRVVREYIETLDDALYGAASEKKPKFVSASDPAAQWTGALRGPAFFAYSTNYLIDTDNAVIMDVEASRSIRQGEVGAARRMIERTQERFGIKPNSLVADSAYGSGKNLSWLVDERKIDPYIPVIDRSERADGTFSRSDFSFDEDNNVYVCPNGKILKTTGRVHGDDNLLYRASKRDCTPCPFKQKCCPKEPARKVPRSIYEHAREVARALAASDDYVEARRERKKVEMLFAHLKRILKLNRLRLRGPKGVKDEFLLAATAQNLRRLAKLAWKPPDQGILVPA
jgi:transposase